MAVTIVRGEADTVLQQFAAALEPYQTEHPGAEIGVYRHGRYSVRIRVTDPDFHGKSRSERHKAVWPLLNELSEEVLADLSMLLLIAPEERTSSLSNLEFDDPIPSKF